MFYFPLIETVFPDWVSSLPGQLIVATHVELRSAKDVSPESVLATLSPTNGRQMVVSRVANGAAWVFTDFMFDNGFSRFLLIDESMVGRQPGRAVQRLFEIERTWSEVQEAHAQILLMQRSVASATENLRQNRNFYDAGTATLTDLLDAETLYTQSRNNLTSAYAAYHTSLAKYMRVTGR
jgi:uncharacterized membrane-anchored protein